MRTLVVLAALLALPALARADAPADPLDRLELRLDAAPAAAAPRLQVGTLRLDGLSATRPVVDDGGGAGRRARVEPVLSLVLGIIPGFGLGHLVANSPRWTLWLVVDVAIAAVWYFGVWGSPYYLEPGPGRSLVGLAVLVERIIEGVDAYRSAGGRGFGALAPDGGRLAEAVPVTDPALARGWRSL